MPKFAFLLLCLFFLSAAQAQLIIQSGAIFSISPGARVTVQGDFSNASAALTNNGILEVQGNFSNTGTYGSTTNVDSLLLTGTAAVTLNSGSSAFKFLQVNKTSGGSVTLAASATVNTKLDFIAGGFSTNPASAFEFIAPSTAAFSFAAGTEISGKVRRTGWANGSTVTFNQANMKLLTQGGTAPTDVLVNMVASGNPTATEREVNRYFYYTPTGGNGYTADVTMPYQTSELNTNTEANLVPWYYMSSEWNAILSNNTINTASHYVTATGLPAATFANTEFKLADPRYTFNVSTILRGAWNGTAMTPALNTAGVLPLTQPYNTTPFNYTGTETVAAIPNANIVDWVLLELRKPSTGLPADATSATITGRKAAFLTSAGAIVDLDGVTPAFFNISKQGASFVVVRHRNHLAVMSNAIPSNTAGTFANNFQSLASVYKNPAASSDPETLLTSSTLYGLWPGDANKTNSVNSIDLSAVRSAISTLLSGYQYQDVNLNGSINSLDLNLSKATISVLGSSSAGNRAPLANGSAPVTPTMTTHVPD